MRRSLQLCLYLVNAQVQALLCLYLVFGCYDCTAPLISIDHVDLSIRLVKWTVEALLPAAPWTSVESREIGLRGEKYYQPVIKHVMFNIHHKIYCAFYKV